MELLLRIAAFFLKCMGFLLTPFFYLFNPYKKLKIPPNKNELLNIPVVDLAQKIRKKEVTSEQVVLAYIERIKEVNPMINALVEDRFEAAIEDAKRADRLVETTSEFLLITNYPILGVPFTVKESCSLKGMSYSVGSLHRKGIKASEDGETVALLKSAGAIPLLVSNTPEFCTSWESSNLVTGRSLNPYDTRHSSGGSSGGEGALIGCGASLFGIGSDIAGSIRVPALFNGIFGHKPTGGLLSVVNHFPFSPDERFSNYLVVGPMCRYAKDLPTLLHIMAGKKADKLRLNEPLYTKDIKIFYKESAGFSLVDIPVQEEIKIAIRNAAEHFRMNGLEVSEAPMGSLQELIECGLAQFFAIQDIPLILRDTENPKKIHSVYKEIFKSIFGLSKYSFAGLFFAFLYETNGLIPKRKISKYVTMFESYRQEFLKMLGDNGVLFYPTYPTTAVRHNDSHLKLSGVAYTMIFNLFGFPSTHVPLGQDRNGLPVGFQIVAAPYQDRLCLCIAAEIEVAFGGWKQPF
ncbi:fatty-acid amide hydrolase 2-A-like [Contarinia nasturtii]|uniref:fatty-acid amide hydrolase 2-A-like n=1 Tax=Contarinia nasturtii TaxID=265458 RepID=UPI0012D482C8|nr:fatty-acid amide hydrolase 2-A-like [Contarinia nasturtii]